MLFRSGGGDQRRITCILTDAGDLGQHFVQLIFLACILQLLEHVGEHAAGHLIQQGVGIHAQALGADLAVGDVLLAQLCKVSADNVQLLQIQTGVVIGALLVGYTNVGKSTIMNLLSKSEVFAENKLFATLDTTVRKVVK